MSVRLEVLWKHYSSYFMGAIVFLGGLQQFTTAVDGLPKWVGPLLAVAALVAKTIPQTPAPVPMVKGTPVEASYGESVMDASK